MFTRATLMFAALMLSRAMIKASCLVAIGALRPLCIFSDRRAFTSRRTLRLSFGIECPMAGAIMVSAGIILSIAFWAIVMTLSLMLRTPARMPDFYKGLFSRC
jgi:uncharacterized membrane protein